MRLPWRVVPLLVAALVGTLIVFVLPVNDYAREGVAAYDCDSPATLALFLYPTIIVTVPGGIWAADRLRRALKGRRLSKPAWTAALCFAGVLLAQAWVFSQWARESWKNSRPGSPCLATTAADRRCGRICEKLRTCERGSSPDEGCEQECSASMGAEAAAQARADRARYLCVDGAKNCQGILGCK